MRGAVMDFGANPVAERRRSQALLRACDVLQRWREVADRETLGGDPLSVPRPTNEFRLFGIACCWEAARARRCAERLAPRANRLLSRNVNSLVRAAFSGRTRPDEPLGLATDAYLFTMFARAHLEQAGLLLAQRWSAGSVRSLANLADLLHRAALDFTLNTVRILETTALGDSRYVGWVSPYVHSLSFYETTRKLFYDYVSGASYADREPHAAPLLLRGALEVQVRQALTVSRFAKGSRLRFVGIWEILASAERLGLKSPVPLPQVRWIYKWCNRVVHAGYREALPRIWYAIEQMRPLLRGTVRRDEYTTQALVTDLDHDAQTQVLRTSLGLADDWVALSD